MSDAVIARALEVAADVQRRSAQAAEALVERLVASVDGSENGHHFTGPDPADGRDDRLGDVTKVWRDSLANLVGERPNLGPPRFDVGAAAPSQVRVVLDPDTRVGNVEVWLHNATTDDFDGLRVHCGEPIAHDGSTATGLSVIVEPACFALPRRSSRGIQISVAAPTAASGTYRGVVLVQGLPDQWLPLEVVIPEPRA